MQSTIKQKKSYFDLNNVARSPTLQTVLMVEKFIDDNSGEYKKTEGYGGDGELITRGTLRRSLVFFINKIKRF